MLEIKLDDNRKWKVYFQYGSDAKSGRITICVIESEEGDRSCRGECTLYFKDKFDKTVGRKIAMERAMKDGNMTKETRTIIWDAYITKMNAPNKKLGADLVMIERVRQMDIEGFGVKHDDAHTEGELLAYGIYLTNPVLHSDMFPKDWDEKWKLKALGGRKQTNLIKAAAMLIAEHDRIERLAK